MNITELLYDCAARRIRVNLIHVRSHTGLHGNDMADAGATAVARGEALPTMKEAADNAGLNRLAWTVDTAGHYISNLNKGLLSRISKKAFGGYTNDPESTARLREATADMSGRFSNAYLASQNTAPWLVKQVLYARHGYLFNAQRKRLYGMGGDGMCPLCRTRGAGPTLDSGPHILGGCNHPHMKGMYINRHNAAVRAIAKCLHNGQHGGGLMTMDAGKEDILPEYCCGTRPPTWLFSSRPQRGTTPVRCDPTSYSSRTCRGIRCHACAAL